MFSWTFRARRPRAIRCIFRAARFAECICSPHCRRSFSRRSCLSHLISSSSRANSSMALKFCGLGGNGAWRRVGLRDDRARSSSDARPYEAGEEGCTLRSLRRIGESINGIVPPPTVRMRGLWCEGSWAGGSRPAPSRFRCEALLPASAWCCERVLAPGRFASAVAVLCAARRRGVSRERSGPMTCPQEQEDAVASAGGGLPRGFVHE
mmetsp:Transcript_15093/g.48032  ORF Transcript_15093/g.48032 Transcript_15093/m.48032 type:complete len:208 (-) Transcript_15093:102-725(-)